jgi:uncharacterized membrane protein YbhN (UPF0104 family)
MRFLYSALRLLIPLAIVVVFVAKADVRLLFQSITLDLAWAMLVTVPLFFVANVPLMWRLGWLVGPPSPSLRHSSIAYILAAGLNTVLPLHLSQVLKATYLREHRDIPMARTFAAIAVERLADLATLSVVAIVFAGTLLVKFTSIETVWIFGGIVLGALVIVAAFGRHMRFFLRFLPNTHLRAFATDLMCHLVDMIVTWRFWVSMAVGLVGMAISLVAYWLLIEMSGSIPLSMVDVLGLFLVVVAFGAALPSLPGGFGVYEAAAIMVLREHGYGLEEAAVVALALHVSHVLFTFCLSLMLLARENLGLSSLRTKLMNVLAETPAGGDGLVR